MLNVEVAASAGFCFGVTRAVNRCYEETEKAYTYGWDKGEKLIYTFGPIIHNSQVVEDLEKKGVGVVGSLEELDELSKTNDPGKITIIIRSHGVSRQVYEFIENRGFKLVDATCPYVKKIHRIVAEKSGEILEDEAGRAVIRDIVIIGDPAHPEVQGISGWILGEHHVICTEEQALAFVKKMKPLLDAKQRNKRVLTIVSQTTFNYNKFNNLVEIISKLRYDGSDVLNTICNATEERQREARELSSRSDMMIVIGDPLSSNTQKLFEICKQECPNTFYIQKLGDLDLRHLPSSGCLGITAGASTPKNLIEEVSRQCQK